MQKRHLGVVFALAASLAIATVPATAGAQPGTQSAKKHPTVKIKVDKTTMKVGQKVTISGKVTKADRGDRVVLQKRIVGAAAWRIEERSRLGKHLGYTFVDKPTTAEARHYRVRVSATKRHTQTTSKKVAVKVYGWKYLATMQMRAESRFFPLHPDPMINTVPYPKSLVGDQYAQAGSIDYNLARKCIRLRATYGVDDGTDETASATINVLADTKSIYTHTFALTQSQPRTLDITGAFRVAFNYTVSNPADTTSPSGAIAVVGTPQVLCMK